MVAQQTHSGDGEIKRLMQDMKTLFFGDEAEEMAPDPDTIVVPDGMTPDAFYVKFCKHVDIVDAAFHAAIHEAKANAPVGERSQYLQML